ncbi:hypothetical protein VTP01DRAFT_1554 [Rhizomucor pusillus]|uniref:uncharacterized protein n=1 Tax=Rhizomucor pusillus TaxID=4840 RepID=UPI00374432A9
MPKANRTPLEVFYGFKILPILTAENTRHYLYMRKHENKSAMEGPLASDRTLFLVNLPVDATMEHLRHLFQAEGGIEKIYYHNASQPTLAYNEEEEDSEQEDNMDDTDQVQRSKRRKTKTQRQQKEQQSRELRRIFHSGASAHIVFVESDVLDKVLNMPMKDRKWFAPNKQQPLGFNRYLLSYDLSRPDHDQLQQQVDTFMVKFKADEYEKEREAMERMSKMDEDGFVVVSRTKKRSRATDGEVAVQSFGAATFDPSKVKKKELTDFYRFQVREAKKNELMNLRRQFEEDKAKIERQKQSRKFKPY